MAQSNNFDYQAIGKENNCQDPVYIEDYQAPQRTLTGGSLPANESYDREEYDPWPECWGDMDYPADLNRKLREIAHRLSNGDLVVDTDDQLRWLITDDSTEEVMTYIGYAPPYDQDNMLHIMASTVENTRLVRYLVDSMPKLMFGRNEYWYYPLHVAIKYKRTSFISAVLDSKFPPDKMKEVLAVEVGDKQMNCIHTAIKEGLDTELVIKLIGKSNEKTLARKDREGLTPLHHAVDYKNCRKGQFEVVQALLKRGDAALDMEGGVDGSFSPFRYHEETKLIEKSIVRKLEVERSSKGIDSADRQQEPTERGSGSTHSRSEDRDTSWSRSRVTKEAERKTRGEENGNETDGRNRLIDKTTPAIIVQKEDDRSNQRRPSNAVQSESMGSQTVPSTAKNPTAANKATKITSRAALMRGKRSGQSKPPGTQKSQRPSIPPDEVTANRIAKELKLHYLRSIFRSSTDSGALEIADGHSQEPRNHDSAVRFLYGDNKKNRHICFDLLNGPAKINSDKFETTYNGFEFDEVLQYVAFRRTEFIIPDLPPRPNERTTKAPTSSGKGRKDMEAPFKWLHNKGVRNIIKVIVDDLEIPSHKDESIVKALKDFNIEILDWRKIDLCPETICSSCPNLREVHLWWSGNNGILRAWSEPEGLLRLKRLEVIHVHQVQELESESWNDRNVTTFRERLRDLRSVENKDRKPAEQLPDVHVPDFAKVPDHPDQQSAGSRSGPDPKIRSENHRWLRIMDTFATGIYNIKLDGERVFFESLPLELQEDVKVALIDDGVQFGHDSLQDKVKDGWSFDSGYDSVELPGARRPFYESTTGHGTLMANMICRVCPNAKIFACRLNVFSEEGEKSRFSAKSAADAVEFCAARNFDIISMSWTIKKIENAQTEQDNTAEIRRLEKAMGTARENGALLFCSAPDEGNISDLSEYCPVGCANLSNQIFKIGAATSFNKEADRTGKVSQLDFILPGHEVKAKGDDKITVDNSLKSGSSVATALAAGLAAMVIQCVRLGAIETYRGHIPRESSSSTETSRARNVLDVGSVSLDDLSDIKKFEHMRRVFEGIPRGKKGEMWKYLEVDKTFEDLGKMLIDRERDEDEKRRALIDFATKLVQYGQDKVRHYSKSTDTSFPSPFIT